MKRKYFLVVLVLILAMFLSGCSGVITPSINLTEDSNICDNLLRGFYAELSNQNFIKALSYCKYGGLTYDYVYNAWDLAIEYPSFYATYQIHNVYNFSYLGVNYLELYYDYSWTSHTKGFINGRRMVFEKINGEWKMF